MNRFGTTPFPYVESTHRFDKWDTFRQGDAFVLPLFVVLACLAVVSLDDFETHRHPPHSPAWITDMGLPAGKVKSEQDQRRWMPLLLLLLFRLRRGKKICPALQDEIVWMFLWLCWISASAYWHIPKDRKAFFSLLMIINIPHIEYHGSVCIFESFFILMSSAAFSVRLQIRKELECVRLVFLFLSLSVSQQTLWK